MSVRRDDPRPPPGNLLLAAFPREPYERLRPALIHVTLDLGQSLYAPEQPIRYAYFLTSGVASLLTSLLDGTSVEVGIIGPEGMVGFPALLSTDAVSHAAIVQVSGAALRVEAEVLGEEFARGGVVQGLLLRYVHAQFAEMAQLAACNRLHDLEERLARWLLMTQDRIQSKTLPFTHEFLGYMLGARRTTVTLTARKLQEAGLIDYRRGRITVLDRGELEQVACECYALMRAAAASTLARPQR